MSNLGTAFGALLSLAVSATAYAADLPTHKAPAPPPVAAPAFSWTGAYMGAFVGANWSHVNTSDITDPNYFGEPALNGNNLTAGGLAGYNWQFNSFVLGGEWEAGYDGRSGSALYGSTPDKASVFGGAEGRIRARAGYAFGNVLLFGAAGGTAMDLKYSVTNLNNGFEQEINRWRGGFNVGGGVEWAFADHWTLRGEYIYDGFQQPLYDFHGEDPTGFDSRTVHLQESTARAVIAYKF